MVGPAANATDSRGKTVNIKREIELDICASRDVNARTLIGVERLRAFLKSARRRDPH